MDQLVLPSPRLQKLMDDNRGAVAVMGIMIGAVLAAVLFHVMNCGFGILWREQAQDAADATAYEAALWNARGMNIVVALNIFIALVMAVLICWRIIIIFTIVMAAFAAICCANEEIPGAETICGWQGALDRAITAEFKNDPKVAARVYQVIKVLHDGQRVVAAATPIMGTLASIKKANDFGAEFGVGFGTQLLPIVNLPTGKAPPKSCRASHLKKVPDQGTWGDHLGKPISLPVSDSGDDGLSTLCGEAGEKISSVIFGIVGDVFDALGINLNISSNGASSKADGIFHLIFSAPGADILFCGEWDKAIDEALDEVGDTKCGKKDTKCNDAKGASSGKSKSNKKTKLSAADLHWAKVWDGANNGGLFFQSWSFVISKRKNVQGLDKVLNIANFVPGGAVVDTSGAAVDEHGHTVAEAEMYFDCTGGWSGGDEHKHWTVGGEACQVKAPWAMSWRARLRRVHDPIDFVVNDLQTTITSALYGALETKFTGAVADKFQPLTDALQSNGGRLIQDVASNQFQEERDKLRKVLVDATTSALPVRSAAAWVDDETTAGVPSLIH